MSDTDDDDDFLTETRYLGLMYRLMAFSCILAFVVGSVTFTLVSSPLGRFWVVLGMVGFFLILLFVEGRLDRRAKANWARLEVWAKECGVEITNYHEDE